MNRTFSVFVFLLLLVGCNKSSIDLFSISEDPKVLWQRKQEMMSSLVNWELQGRLAVQVGTQSESAFLNWRYDGDKQRLQLLGPFGSGLAKISQDARNAVLEDSEGLELQGRSAEEVIFRRFNWIVPFTEMGYWVRGMPAPGKHSGVGFDIQGRARHLIQRGWEIEYLEYEIFQAGELPTRILIRALPGNEIFDNFGQETNRSVWVKLVINSWTRGIAKE